MNAQAIQTTMASIPTTATVVPGRYGVIVSIGGVEVASPRWGEVYTPHGFTGSVWSPYSSEVYAGPIAKIMAIAKAWAAYEDNVGWVGMEVAADIVGDAEHIINSWQWTDYDSQAYAENVRAYEEQEARDRW